MLLGMFSENGTAMILSTWREGSTPQNSDIISVVISLLQAINMLVVIEAQR